MFRISRPRSVRTTPAQCRRLGFESFESRLLLASDSPITFGSNYGDTVGAGSQNYQVIEHEADAGSVVVGTIDNTNPGLGGTWLRLYSQFEDQFTLRSDGENDGVHWAAIDPGAYTVDGKLVQAGKLQNALNGSSVTFSQPFSSPPVILLTIDETVDDNGGTFARVVGNPSTNGFSIWTNGAIDGINWIAMEPGLYLAGDYAWQAGTVFDPDVGDIFPFNQSFQGRPGLLATIHDVNNSGPSWARVETLTPTNFGVQMNDNNGEYLHFVAFADRDEFMVDLDWDFTGLTGGGTVRRSGDLLQGVENDTQNVNFSGQFRDTNSLTLQGDSVTVDFATGGMFEIPEGIDVLGSAVVNNQTLGIVGNSGTLAQLSQSASGLSLQVTELDETLQIDFQDYENLNLSGLLLASLQGVVDLGSLNISVASTVPLDLGAVTMMNGGSLAVANGVTIGNGEAFLGSGAVNAPIAADLGSTLAATGDLALGDLGSLVGFFSDGVLNTSINTVTLNDADEVVLGSLTTIGDGATGGALVAGAATAEPVNDNDGLPPDFLLEDGKSITGRGDVAGNFRNMGSVIGEGTAPGERITFVDGFTVTGIGYFENTLILGNSDLGLSPAVVTGKNQAFGGMMRLELGGNVPGSGPNSHDQIVDLGELTLLDGVALEVSPWNGYQPSVGDEFEVLVSTSGITGTFENVIIDPSFTELGIDFKLDYRADSLNLMAVAASATGDFDSDGFVNGVDFLAWQRGESLNPVGAGDLADWYENYGQGSAFAAASLKELPTSAAPKISQAGFAEIVAAAVAWGIGNGVDVAEADFVDEDAPLTQAYDDVTFLSGVTNVAPESSSVEGAAADESDGDQQYSWLANELLERVFG